MNDDRRTKVDMFRRMMPRQFEKMTKLCAKCGARLQWNEEKRDRECPRCKR